MPRVPPVRVLMVTTVASTLTAFLTPYAMHLRDRGWTVEAAARGAASDPEILRAFDRAHELSTSRSLSAIRQNAQAMRALVRLLGSGYDIVHVHTPIAGFLVRLAARLLPRDVRPAIIYTAHGFHFHKHGRWITNVAFRTAERVAGRWTDALIVINREDERAARAARIVPRRHLHYMPGIGVDTSWYSRESLPLDSGSNARHELAIDATTPVIVMIGELSLNKRPFDVVDALAQLRNRGVHLVFLGDGPMRSRLQSQAERAGVAGRVSFAGVVTDVRPLLSTATVLVLVSGREGLPRSIMEALSMEVPVVASTARGSADLVGSDAGLITPIGDAAAISEALDRLLDDPAAARIMGHQGRVRMIDTYSIEPLLIRHDALYDAVITTRASTGPKPD